MNKNDLIKYAAIAGGAYAVYWYITSYGPTGAVSAGHASYWDTWFGGATAQPQTQPQPGAQVPVGYPNQPVSSPPPNTQPVLTQPSQPPAATINQGVKQQIIAASNAAGANQPGSQIQGGYAIPDIWSYFWQQVTGRTITTQQMSQAFNNSAPMTLDQFMTAIAGIGLSGIGHIVQAPSAPTVPSMNFGGSFRRPGMRGMGGRPAINGGQTIQ